MLIAAVRRVSVTSEKVKNDAHGASYMRAGGQVTVKGVPPACWVYHHYPPNKASGGGPSLPVTEAQTESVASLGSVSEPGLTVRWFFLNHVVSTTFRPSDERLRVVHFQGPS